MNRTSDRVLDHPRRRWGAVGCDGEAERQGGSEGEFQASVRNQLSRRRERYAGFREG
jgi:hypothetical protein